MIDNIDVTDAIALGADRPANTGTPVAASDSGGGGALGLGWLAALALAVIALSSRRPRSLGPAPERAAR